MVYLIEHRYQGGHTTWFLTSFWLHRQADLEVNNRRLIFWKCDHYLISHSILMTYGAVEGVTISIRIYLQLFATRTVVFSRKRENYALSACLPIVHSFHVFGKKLLFWWQTVEGIYVLI